MGVSVTVILEKNNTKIVLHMNMKRHHVTEMSNTEKHQRSFSSSSVGNAERYNVSFA